MLNHCAIPAPHAIFVQCSPIYRAPTQASHQCGPGSIPGLGVICGLSLLLVLVLARSERFFSGYSGFPFSSKTNISKFQFDLDYLSKTENSVSPTFLPQYETQCVKWQTIATKTIAPSISFKMFLTPDVSTTIISATANVSKPFNSATKTTKQGPKQSAPLTL